MNRLSIPSTSDLFAANRDPLCDQPCDRCFGLRLSSLLSGKVRDSRYKFIKTLLRDREDPGARKCLANGASNFRGSPTTAELDDAEESTQAAYETWLNPPEYQLYDLLADRHEFANLATDPNLSSIKKRLINRLEKWQIETADPLANQTKLARLTAENDRCVQDNVRSPKGGWQYVKYLAPLKSKSVTGKSVAMGG